MAVYKRWDDPGAVDLCGQPGAMIAVLDSVLIPAGWTKEFTDTNRAAYRNDLSAGGNDCWLYADDTDAQMCRVTPYESMTDIDTGTNPAAPAGGLFWRKSTSSNSDPRPWIICADRLRMYINVGQVNSTALSAYGTASNSWVGGAGAPECFYAGDPSVFGAGHQGSTQYLSGMLMGAAAGGSYMTTCFYLSRNTSLSATPTVCGLPLGRYQYADHAGYGNGGANAFPTNGPGNGYVIPCLFAERNGNSIAGGMRCRLPGAYMPISQISAARRMGDVLPASPGSVDPRPLLAMAGGGGDSSSNENGTLLIDHTEPGDWS